MPEKQWSEIKYGLQKGKIDKKNVILLSNALSVSDSINANNQDMINEKQFQIDTINAQLELTEQQVNQLQHRSEIENTRFINEQKKKYTTAIYAGLIGIVLGILIN